PEVVLPDRMDLVSADALADEGEPDLMPDRHPRRGRHDLVLDLLVVLDPLCAVGLAESLRGRRVDLLVAVPRRVRAALDGGCAREDRVDEVRRVREVLEPAHVAHRGLVWRLDPIEE